MRNLSLLSKIVLVLIVILSLFFVLSFWASYRQQRDFTMEEAVEKARIVAYEAIRTREYLSHELQTGKVELSFERYGIIPVVASQRIGERVAEDLGYQIRQVSNRYRNPKNAPDDFEAAALGEFGRDPLLKERFAITTLEGERVFRYLRPFLVDQSCLQCHGDPDEAPAFIAKLFPRDRDQAYNYQIGEVIGAASVTIPMDRLTEQIATNLRASLIYLAGIFLAMVACLGLLTRVAVTRPLGRLGEAIGKTLRSGRFERKIPGGGGDEIGRLIDGFNEMMEHLQEEASHVEESERRFRALTETARDAIVSFLANGQIILFNSQAERLFGYSKTEVLGASVAQLVHEQCTSLHEAGCEEYLRDQAKTLLQDVRKIPCRRRDGTLMEMELLLSEAESDGHKFYTAILRD